MFILNGLGGVP